MFYLRIDVVVDEGVYLVANMKHGDVIPPNKQVLGPRTCRQRQYVKLIRVTFPPLGGTMPLTTMVELGGCGNIMTMIGLTCHTTKLGMRIITWIESALSIHNYMLPVGVG